MNTAYIITAMLGPTEIIILAIIILLLFGGRKIPELMKGLGRGMKEFKQAQKEENNTPETTEESKES